MQNCLYFIIYAPVCTCIFIHIYIRRCARLYLKIHLLKILIKIQNLHWDLSYFPRGNYFNILEHFLYSNFRFCEVWIRSPDDKILCTCWSVVYVKLFLQQSRVSLTARCKIQQVWECSNEIYIYLLFWNQSLAVCSSRNHLKEALCQGTSKQSHISLFDI